MKTFEAVEELKTKLGHTMIKEIDFCGEITRIPLKTDKIGIGDNIDIKMTACFDKFRGNHAHGAIVCRECLVEHGHIAADGRLLFEKIDFQPRISAVERRLHAGDTRTHNENRADFTGLFFRFSIARYIVCLFITPLVGLAGAAVFKAITRLPQTADGDEDSACIVGQDVTGGTGTSSEKEEETEAWT